MTHHKTLVALAGISLLFSAGSASAAGISNRPNVLFIIADQLCADALSCRMGPRYLHTPTLDHLAEEGTFFTHAFAANPLCVPSRNAMFTGRYPHEVGVTANIFSHLDVAKFPSVETYFRGAGYETAYLGKSHLCSNMAEAFDISMVPKEGPGHDHQTLAAALSFMRTSHSRPFFCVVSFMNPHNACELARGQVLPDGPIGQPPPLDLCPPAPANLAPPRNETDTMRIMRRGYHASSIFPVGNFTTDDWRRFRWGYYRLIEKVDAQIGEVLDALRKSGEADNTIIVFTSDHGECAGAHGFNQKTVLYEESIRVPLIVCVPGRTNAHTCDKLVNTGIDLMPTLLDLAGLPVPQGLPGRSLRSLAQGESVPSWRTYVVSENDMEQAGAIDAVRPTVQGRMVRTQRFKYCIYDRGEHRESLVDLKADPGETQNLAGEPASHETLLHFRGLLARFAKEHNDALATQMLADNVRPIPFQNEPELLSTESKKWANR